MMHSESMPLSRVVGDPCPLARNNLLPHHSAILPQSKHHIPTDMFELRKSQHEANMDNA